MSNRFAQVIVLVEDKQQRTFTSRLLQAIGYPVHKLNILPLPAGEGSGEQYVREQYPIQVKELRPRAQYMDVALVATIDGDHSTVAGRQKQLADQLAASELEPRGADEKIVHLIPCRSIETWIEYLLDITTTVDEAHKYDKLKGRERDCQKAVEELARLCKSTQPLPATCPPSLTMSIAELKRLG